MSWPTILHTDRVLLRPFDEGDREAVITMNTDPDVRHYLGGPVDGAALELIRSSTIGGRWGVFCVEHRSSASVIGSCSLSRERGSLELSYHLMPSYWGRGLAGEACRAVLEWAWAVQDDDVIIAVTQVANARSRRLLDRLGFVERETFIEWDADQVLAQLTDQPLPVRRSLRMSSQQALPRSRLVSSPRCR